MSRVVRLLNMTRSTIGARALLQTGSLHDLSTSAKTSHITFLPIPEISSCTKLIPTRISPVRHYSSEPDTTITLPPTLDYDELKLLLDNDEVLLIDVRNPIELEEDGEIDEAMSVPLGDLKAALALSPELLYGEYGLQHHGLLQPDTPIVFSCKAGNRASKAVNIAVEAGYTNVSNFTGGWREWSSRN